MLASELIEILKQKIATYGDRPVYSGGTDYPEEVETVVVETKGDSFVPKNAFYL